MKPVDLTGQVVGRLTAINRLPESNKHGQSMWLCKCTCGNTSVLSLSNFRSGKVQSCGCLYAENASSYNSTHGASKTPEYAVWKTIKQRINNPKNADYPSYGGRGIKLHSTWNESFESFLADMGNRPGPGYSVERVDNDGDYCPSNCRWATIEEQANNKSNNILVMYQGKMMTIAQVAKLADVGYEKLRLRIHRGQDAAYAVIKMKKLSSGSKKYRWKRRGGYECSSVGDKRFSALYAKLPDGRTIEEAYQLDVKGYRIYTNYWKDAKGKPALDLSVDLWGAYKQLWRVWAKANPELMRELAKGASENDYYLSDVFASTPVSQARALSELLNEGL